MSNSLSIKVFKIFYAFDIAIKRINNELTNPEYFLQFVRAENMQRKLTGANPGSAISNLVPMSEVKKWEVFVPIKAEQKKLGSFFEQLDDTIALHQRKLTLLKCLKQMYLQKLFPQNGENIPALRFAGFTEIWDQRKLKDLYERNSEKNNGQFDSENTISIASMKFKPEGNGAAEESINSYKESITLFAFFVELKEKKQSRWLFQSQICRIWAS